MILFEIYHYGYGEEYFYKEINYKLKYIVLKR